jgi:hypothetical protein
MALSITTVTSTRPTGASSKRMEASFDDVPVKVTHGFLPPWFRPPRYSHTECENPESRRAEDHKPASSDAKAGNLFDRRD